jgi:hypothetical protein
VSHFSRAAVWDHVIVFFLQDPRHPLLSHAEPRLLTAPRDLAEGVNGVPEKAGPRQGEAASPRSPGAIAGWASPTWGKWTELSCISGSPSQNYEVLNEALFAES